MITLVAVSVFQEMKKNINLSVKEVLRLRNSSNFLNCRRWCRWCYRWWCPRNFNKMIEFYKTFINSEGLFQNEMRGDRIGGVWQGNWMLSRLKRMVTACFCHGISKIYFRSADVTWPLAGFPILTAKNIFASFDNPQPTQSENNGGRTFNPTTRTYFRKP